VELRGASALVTGGASGLGAATARALAAGGASVVLLDLDDTKGAQVAADIGGRYVHADVTDEAQVVAGVEAAVGLAPLRVLVCCAGIGMAMRTIGRDGSYDSAHRLDAFATVVAVNLVGTFNCIRLAASAMSRNDPDDGGERGVVVSTASIAAFDGQIGQAAYSASKGGIVGMTLPVARDLAVVGIRVTTIAPGLVDTPIYDSFPEPAAFKEQLKRDVLFPPRLGAPDEYASLVLEVVRNRYLNGEVIRIDGGARLQPK
jgi:NAD(P)-dependent dehydrogenase (short-subunit alcohol dehydrogenase family)